MNIYLYQHRILALEKKLIKARRHLNRLLRQARYTPDSVDRLAFKSQLDTIKTLISLTKEETAFFVRLGQLYDVVKLQDCLIDVLKRRDPDLLSEILLEVNAAWAKLEVTPTN